MKTVEDKYLIITQFDTIDARCSECSTAGITLYNCSNINELVNKVSEVSFCANAKVLGMYKKIDTLTIDKDCRLKDNQNENS